MNVSGGRSIRYDSSSDCFVTPERTYAIRGYDLYCGRAYRDPAEMHDYLEVLLHEAQNSISSEVIIDIAEFTDDLLRATLRHARSGETIGAVIYDIEPIHCATDLPDRGTSAFEGVTSKDFCFDGTSGSYGPTL